MATVAQFDITYTQFLDEHGKLAGELPDFAKDHTVLKELYKMMVLTRTFDKKAIALQRTGKMGTYAPINGQEAISTAIGHAMRPDDVFVPYYRDYAAQFQRGVKMSEILAFGVAMSAVASFLVIQKTYLFASPLPLNVCMQLALLLLSNTETNLV